jgi:hypothetical protein
MNENLLRFVYDRLDLDGAANEPWAAAVEAALDEQHGAAPLPAPAVATGDPPGVRSLSSSSVNFSRFDQNRSMAKSESSSWNSTWRWRAMLRSRARTDAATFRDCRSALTRSPRGTGG